MSSSILERALVWMIHYRVTVPCKSRSSSVENFILEGGGKVGGAEVEAFGKHDFPYT